MFTHNQPYPISHHSHFSIAPYCYPSGQGMSSSLSKSDRDKSRLTRLSFTLGNVPFLLSNTQKHEYQTQKQIKIQVFKKKKKNRINSQDKQESGEEQGGHTWTGQAETTAETKEDQSQKTTTITTG